ncbi:uncharacterized protein [Arachis hypogaea]|uniref:uncharacterized protein n=1 Tax=Arachis hypogaea TaxID=3818 RepID=UPI003B213DA9
MPGNDIDVYLQSLIDELKQLWAGVNTYDASEKKNFKMHAALLDILRQLEDVHVSLGKVQSVAGKRRRGQLTVVQDESLWKKRSIFFDLPYWENNELHHNLDVMHIEKNVCDNILFAMLNESGKSKDHLKARKDLQLMGIRHDMWPLEGGKYPSEVFTMSNPQKDVFLRTIKNVVFPDGYSSNISHCVDLKQCKLLGLKSHDCHILMEHLLPIASKHVLRTLVFAVLAELSTFFRQICSKSIDPQQLPLLQDCMVHTLWHMEMIFPPSFFTVMVHLTVHLVDEPGSSSLFLVCSRRYLCRLKHYVCNRAQPEGSITEGYLSEEILTFCSRYLDNVETRINQPMRVDDRLSEALPSNIANMFLEVGKAVGAASFFTLTATENLQTNLHVLVNYIAVEKLLEAMTKRKLRNKTRSQAHIDSVVHREFSNWFRHEVPFGSTSHSNELQWLTCGPIVQERRFKAYNNSRVYVTSDTRSYASKRDSNVAVGGVLYYGRLVDIIELNYSGQFTVVLFKCLWVDTTSGRGIQQDVLGHTCVNFAIPIYIGDREDDEPYILASEAHLVFYVDDEVDNEWSVVDHVKPRDLFDMGEDYEHCEVDLHPQPCLSSLPEFDLEGLRLTRDGDLEESTNDGVEECDEATDS